MKFLFANGEPALADDPKRLVWYSALCGFWTDDWSLLSETGPGIPCCPRCKCVGCQIEAGKWEEAARRFSPGYPDFLHQHKGKCLGNFMKLWEEHKAKAQLAPKKGEL